MLKSAKETFQSFQGQSIQPRRRDSPDYGPRKDVEPQSDEDDFGPAPPPGGTRHGPTIPRLDDLTERYELREEDRAREQAEYVDNIRYARKQDRKAQKERLEELVPRADPGSRETTDWWRRCRG